MTPGQDNVYLMPDASLPYCKGCGHALVIRHLGNALAKMGMPPRSVVLTTDIGCVGLPDSLFPYLHTVHTTHGRSTAFATGMALAEVAGEPSGLKPIVLIGDGGAMIGLLHLVHAAQLNVDVTVLLHNNYVFGMTGGQHSAMTPVDFSTKTTPDGNFTPPLDFLSLLQSAHAGYLARQFATDRELDSVIAEAIAHPGFAVVEVVELCPVHAGRRNQLTGAKLKEIVKQQGMKVGRLDAGTPRSGFTELYREMRDSHAVPGNGICGTAAVAEADLKGELRLIFAGSAGERVQSSAKLLCQTALAAGLFTTQKNDNPVTIGTGFSVSEVCLSSRPIEYTGMDAPDVVIAVSEDGSRYLGATGIFGRCREDTLLFMDESLGAPVAKGKVSRLPLRSEAGSKSAALAGMVYWLAGSKLLPEKAWEAAVSALPKPQQAVARQAWTLAASLATVNPK